jgi:hypothetical protein
MEGIEKLKTVVHDYLRGFEDLAAVKTKDVRQYVQTKLNLPQDYFAGEQKEALLDIITSFKQPAQKKAKAANSDVDINLDNRLYKEGRFSKEESDIVMEAGLRYTQERGINLIDLCTMSKTKGNGVSKHLDFWREVSMLLPARKRDVSVCC